jgi:cell division protein FtsW
MILSRNAAFLVVLVVLSLCGLGIVMLYSASAFSQGDGDSLVFVRDQGLWLVLGLIAFGVTSLTDYRLWYRYVWIILAITSVLLVLCYVPGIGRKINGASRWISAGGITLQPSELAKIAMILFMGAWYSCHGREVKTLRNGFLIPAGVAGLLLGLIVFEKDIGTTLLLGSTAMAIWFVVGVRWRYLLLASVVALVGIGVIVMKDPVRMKRLTAHTQKGGEDERGAAYQQKQSLIALGSGGVGGLGLGESRQKMFYVPEAHTDFIFAIIGEELGLRVTLAVVLGFVVLLVAGTTIAVRSPDLGGGVIAMGIVALLGIQVFINIGVVTKFLPNKGLALPFISKGGSGLVISLALIGLLISIARQTEAMANEPVLRFRTGESRA